NTAVEPLANRLGTDPDTPVPLPREKNTASTNFGEQTGDASSRKRAELRDEGRRQEVRRGVRRGVLADRGPENDVGGRAFRARQGGCRFFFSSRRRHTRFSRDQTCALPIFERLKKQYGKGRERKTELRAFDRVEAAQVALANVKLYVNRADGFVGTGLRKDEY